MEKSKKKGKIISLIILLLMSIITIFSVTYVIPKVKEEGIGGLLNPINLSKEDKEYYDLYLNELEKYYNLSEDNYTYDFQLYYFEEIEGPVIALRHNYHGEYQGYPLNKLTLFYIKDKKINVKEYNAVSNLSLMYNTEKDEIDYYIFQFNDGNYTISLVKDIITDNSNPYVIRLKKSEEFLATYKNNGGKVWIPKFNAMFNDHLETYLDNKVYDQEFSFVDGINKFKGYLKKAISSKFYLKDLLTDRAREYALEQLDYYSIEPGQKILDNNVNNEKVINTNNNTSIDTKENKTVSKCNNGFVYVSDDNRCYNSNDMQNQINRCGEGEDDLGSDCATAVEYSLCSTGPEQYEEINGKCYDKYTIHVKSIECPSGYDILFGNYSGQIFNGACYKYNSPNY